MRKKTIWTVVAGTSAAVLAPGVAYALVAGGASMPTEGPGIGSDGSETSLGDQQGPDRPGIGADLDLAENEDDASKDADKDADKGEVGPKQVPAVESLKSGASAPAAPSAVTAVSALSPVSPPTPAPAPRSTTQKAPESPQKSTPKKAPAPKQVVQSAPSPVSAPSPATPPSPDSPDSPESPDSAD